MEQESEYKTTLKELEEKDKQSNDLLKTINNIVDNLKNGELSLQDIIAEEESLENRCYELQETCKDIIKLRQWLDLLSLQNQF